MAAISREDLTINSIIGPGTSVAGDVDAAGFVRVDGNLKGQLTTKGRVVVGEQARIAGDIGASAVTVGGVVKGNIMAKDRVHVLATAIVLGDVVTTRIQADQGCLIHGRIVSCGDAEAWDGKIAEYRDRRGVRHALANHAPSAERSDG